MGPDLPVAGIPMGGGSVRMPATGKRKRVSLALVAGGSRQHQHSAHTHTHANRNTQRNPDSGEWSDLKTPRTDNLYQYHR